MKYTKFELKMAKLFLVIIMIALIMSALTGCASSWHTVDTNHRIHYPSCNVCDNSYYNTYSWYHWNNITVIKPNKPNKPIKI